MMNWIEKIKNYTSYMSDIVTAIRGQAASFTENTFETFSINDLIKNVNILMKHELQQALVTLNISYNLDNEIDLHGNMNSLVQIINNLISNSIQSYNGEPNKSIDLIVENTKDNVIITISDKGCGIPPEIQKKLFKEFVSTKGKNGTGIRIIYILFKFKNTIWWKYKF